MILRSADLTKYRLVSDIETDTRRQHTALACLARDNNEYVCVVSYSFFISFLFFSSVR